MAKLIIYKSTKGFTSVKPVNEGWEHLSLSREKKPPAYEIRTSRYYLLTYLLHGAESFLRS
jgi:hypothetical protein